jgi:primosomal protein N''
MADLSPAEKAERNDALRRELSALRIENEHAALEGHNRIHEETLDRDHEVLVAQVEAERARLESQTGGSVDDAKAAMAAAAAPPDELKPELPVPPPASKAATSGNKEK